MTAVWHAFAYLGPRPSVADAKDLGVAVPPLRIRDWLRKPTVLREGTWDALEPIGRWFGLKADLYSRLSPAESDPIELWRRVPRLMRLLHEGRDVMDGYRLRDGRYLSLAVIAVWDLPPAPVRDLQNMNGGR